MINRSLNMMKTKVRALGGSKILYLPRNYCQDYAISEGDNLIMGIDKEGEQRVVRDLKVKQLSNKSGNKGMYITIPTHVRDSLSLDKGDEVSLSLRPESDSVTTRRELEEKGLGWPEGGQQTVSSGDKRFLRHRSCGGLVAG